MPRDTVLEATIVAKYAALGALLDERARRLWAAAELAAIGYGGDAVVSAATGWRARRSRGGRRELAQGARNQGDSPDGRGRPRLRQDATWRRGALDALVEPLTRGDPMSPLRWTCKSRAIAAGWSAMAGR